jgi:streptogramin lyase
VGDDRNVDATTGQSTTFIDTGLTQNSLAIGAGSVWVIGASNLVRIDAATKAVTKEIDFQTGLPSALQLPLTTLAFGEGAVWIFGYTGSVSAGAHLLIKVDPTSETVVDTAEIAVDGANDGVAAGLGSVWVSASLGEKLLRIDPATLDVVEEIAMPGAEPEEIALGNEIVWMTDWSNSTVWGVHASSKEIGSLTLDERPGGITFLAP